MIDFDENGNNDAHQYVHISAEDGGFFQSILKFFHLGKQNDLSVFNDRIEFHRNSKNKREYRMLSLKSISGYQYKEQNGCNPIALLLIFFGGIAALCAIWRIVYVIAHDRFPDVLNVICSIDLISRITYFLFFTSAHLSEEIIIFFNVVCLIIGVAVMMIACNILFSSKISISFFPYTNRKHCFSFKVGKSAFDVKRFSCIMNKLLLEKGNQQVEEPEQKQIN